MTEALAPSAAAAKLMNLLRRADGTATLPQPFARDILLVQEIHIAGVMYRDWRTISTLLKVGDCLTLRREPDNAHDELAIKLLTPDNLFVGYVSRDRNEILARLMDAGKLLVGEVVNMQLRPRWLDIEIKIHMREL